MATYQLVGADPTPELGGSPSFFVQFQANSLANANACANVCATMLQRTVVLVPLGTLGPYASFTAGAAGSMTVGTGVTL